MRENVPANWDKRHTRRISFFCYLKKNKIPRERDTKLF